MHDWVRALRYEVEATRSRAAGSALGLAIKISTDSLVDTYSDAIERAGKTEAGAKVGKAASAVSRFIAGLPFVNFAPDALRSANCVDLLKADAGTAKITSHINPVETALAYVRLAEALEAYRHEVALLRGMRAIIDPVGYAGGTALRTATQLGKTAQPSQTERLVRQAYALVLKQEKRTFESYWVLARIYLLAGKPGLALQYARQAALVARRDREQVPDDEFAGMTGSWLGDKALGFFIKGIEGMSLRFFGQPLRVSTVTLKQEGAAYVTAGWALWASGDNKSAREMAQRAIDLDFSLGYEVLAAALEPSGWFGARVSRRQEKLTAVNPGDMRFYKGHYRGVVTGTGANVMMQLDKFGKL